VDNALGADVEKIKLKRLATDMHSTKLLQSSSRNTTMTIGKRRFTSPRLLVALCTFAPAGS
jgi:hypothetical protein